MLVARSMLILQTTE